MSRTIVAFFLFSLMGFSSYTQVTSPANQPTESGGQSTTGSEGNENTLQNYQSLLNHVEEDADKVKDLYHIKTQVASDYGGASQTISRLVKPQLYKAGERLRKYYMNQLDEVGEANYEDKILILNDVESLNSRLRTLSRKADTKSLEKSLKKVKDPSQIETILLAD